MEQKINPADNCIFCKITRGEVPATIVYEDSHVIAFPPLEQDMLTKGHLLVIPKRHFTNIYDMPEAELAHVISAIKSIAIGLREHFGVDGVNILNANEKAAEQSVFHFHIHLCPRYIGDNISTWPKTGYVADSTRQLYIEMKKALEK